MLDETIAETLSLVDAEKPLPEGWRSIKLGEICHISWGNTSITKASYVKTGFTAFSAAGADGFLSHYENEKDAVILSAIGAQCGKCFFASGKWTAIKNTIVISPFDSDIADAKYLYFYLNQKDIFPSASMAQPFITMSGAQSVKIPLPPTLEEQRRIASILDEQMKAVEQARLAVEEQLAAATLLPNAFLRSVFESEEAQRWQKRKLGELLNLRKDVVHPRNNPKGEALFVGLEHIESSTGKRIGAVEVKKEQLTGRKPQFYKDDLVYGYLRPYLNKLWVAEFDGLCSVDQYVYSVDTNKADINYLAYFMRSPVYLAKAPIDSTPGQLPRIRTEEVASVEINLPDITKQRDIAEKLKEQMQATGTLKQSLTDKLAAVKKLPAALLRKAFAGEM